jgi:ribose transport system permease protein
MTATASDNSLEPPSQKRRWLSQAGLPILIVAIAIVTGVIEPRFWSAANMQNLVRSIAPLQILVAGQLFAVLSGGLDLSVASVMAFAGVVGMIAMPHVGIAGGVAIMVLTGTVIGFVNGAIVVSFRVSPLIVTLGMLSIAKGLSLLLTGGLPMYDVPEDLVDTVGFGDVYGFPMSSMLAFATMIVGAVILRKTVFGRHVYAVGSSANSARNSGVRVQRVTLLIYMISGTAAGIAAVVMTSWVSAAQPLAGEGLELQSLAAVVVGGVALAGGSGTMLQSFFGALVLGLLSNALNMAGVSSFLQTLVVGVVILLAVIVDRLRANKS